MKNIHQNVRQRIGKNRVKGSNYLINHNSVNISLPSYFPSGAWANPVSKNVFKQLSSFLSKKKKSSQELIIKRIDSYSGTNQDYF